MQRLREQIGRSVKCAYSNDGVRDSLAELLQPLANRCPTPPQQLAGDFSQQLPAIVDACMKDAERYPIQDPALEDLDEVFYASNGFWATVAYRIAHVLCQLKTPILPRTIAGIAHSRTGVDIHPGASIAPGLFIDHGTGIAIGCTAVLAEDVNRYNGVVLGTRSKPKKKTDQASGGIKKRHPTICRGVSLYTNAFVGGDVQIGEHAVIRAYAFVCHDVEPGTLVLGKTGDTNPDDTKIESTPTPPTIADSVAKDPHPLPEKPNMTTRGTLPAVPRGTQPVSSVLDMIGNTPAYEIRNLNFIPAVRIFAKLEGENPSGSIKDRLALSLVEEGEISGALTPGKVILESTSGNTGIGLAMVGAAKGYEVVLTMSSAMSEERKQVLRAFGAKLIETAPGKGTGGAIEEARKMVEREPGKYWLANQHASSDNPQVHYKKTAQEILQQVPDVTHFVAGIGTFGTLRGAGGRLREAVGAKVVGLEPVLGKPIQGLRNMQEPNAPSLYTESLLDEKLNVLPEHAFTLTRELALKEGLFVGMSSGAAMWGAMQVANLIESGTIVVIFPDRGEKYLSTPLFDAPQPKTETTKQMAAIDAPALKPPQAAFAYAI